MMMRKLERTILAGALLSLMSLSAVSAERATPARPSPPNATSESRRVVPFRSDKTDSWMCQNASAFWCADSRATQAPPTSSSPNRGRGRG